MVAFGIVFVASGLFIGISAFRYRARGDAQLAYAHAGVLVMVGRLALIAAGSTGLRQGMLLSMFALLAADVAIRVWLGRRSA